MRWASPTYPAAATPKNGAVSRVIVCIDRTQIDWAPTVTSVSRGDSATPPGALPAPGDRVTAIATSLPTSTAVPRATAEPTSTPAATCRPAPSTPLSRFRTARADRRSSRIRTALSSTVPP